MSTDDKYVLTPEKALELLERAVKERGEDYVYDEQIRGISGLGVEDELCHYLNEDGSPSCIVGYALSYLAEELDATGIVDQLLAADQSIPVPTPRGLHFEEITIPTPALDLLSYVQSVQDHGEPWGEALKIGYAYKVEYLDD